MKLVSDTVSMYMTDLHHPLSDMNTFITADMDAFECIATKLDVREFSLQNISAEIKSKILECCTADRQWPQYSALAIYCYRGREEP